ncbi:hypothetical protein D3C72_1867730 [compost metagenome]
MLAGIDQVGVDRGLHALAGLDEHPRQQALDVLGAGALEQVGAEVDVAVVEGGDFQIAHRHAVVAGHLGLLLGHGGGKRRRQWQGQGEGGEEGVAGMQRANHGEAPFRNERGLCVP